MVRGNLLDEPVEAIVNAANGRLAHGGGIAGAISRAAGPALQAEPRQGEGDEETKLTKALAAAFDVAKERGWETVSFPAVSSGIFAVPLDVCARAYVAAARAAPIRQVRLCLRDEPVIDAVLKELKK